MRFTTTAFTLLLLLFAIPAIAQDRPVDWTIWGSLVDIQGSNELGEFTVDTDDGIGLGLSANFFLSDRVSTEIAVFSVRSDADMTFDQFEFELGRVELIPVTLGLQYHFAGQSRWDPYVGAGAAWVSASDLESDDLDLLEKGPIEIDDELTWFANAGLGVRIGRQFGLVIDVRYIEYEPTSTSKLTGGEEDLELSPLMASIGLRFRF
jgi:outer membrane protein